MMRNSSRADREYQKKLVSIATRLNEITSQHETLLAENEKLFNRNCLLRDYLGIEKNFEFSKSLLNRSAVASRSQIEKSILESYNRFKADCERLLMENDKLKRENKKFEDYCKQKPNPQSSHFVLFRMPSRTAKQIIPKAKPAEKPRWH